MRKSGFFPRLALVNLVPFAAVWVTYTLVRKGVVLEELQYRKK